MMSEKIKCPHCAKVIDFGKLAKQNKPDSVTSMSVYAGVIRKDIPAYVDEFYGNDDSKVCKAGREFSVTLSNLTQWKSSKRRLSKIIMALCPCAAIVARLTKKTLKRKEQNE